jgi:glycine cleavage system aminomethyltransferase T
MAGEKEIGEVTSGAQVVLDGVAHSVALGYVKRSAIAEGDSVQVDGRAAKVVALPFQW